MCKIVEIIKESGRSIILPELTKEQRCIIDRLTQEMQKEFMKSTQETISAILGVSSYQKETVWPEKQCKPSYLANYADS